MGIEPTTSAWKAEVLPLNYTRIHYFFSIKTKNTHLPCLFLFQLIRGSRCVEATRCLFIEASLVAEVLPLNYTRIHYFFSIKTKNTHLSCLFLFQLIRRRRCVEATRCLFIEASLVAEVLPLNYTRIHYFFSIKTKNTHLSCLFLFQLIRRRRCVEATRCLFIEASLVVAVMQ